MSKSKETSTIKTAVLPAKSGTKKAILDFLKNAMDKKNFDAVIIPMRVPAGDSFV